MDREREANESRKFIITTMITVGLVLALVVPLIALVFTGDRGDNEVSYMDQTGAVVGDAPMTPETRQLWEDYLDSAPSIVIPPADVGSSTAKEDIDPISSIPDGVVDQGGTGREEPPGTLDGDASDEASNDDKDYDSQDGGSEREVEESDIVKAVGDRIYVLNPYMGLMVVNMEDPSDPYIEGKVNVLGSPISMYIVDFLGFVIVSNAPPLEKGGDLSSGRMYIIDLSDNSAPRVVKAVDIEGYPIDSRRVGEVIYVISNEYDHYYGWIEPMVGMVDDVVAVDVESSEGGEYGEQNDNIHIVSIAFNDPSSFGEVDRDIIPGDAGEVHASQLAIFIPQASGDWSDPRTSFTYVDISDPKGDIEIRDTITIDGYLQDRYQMDHYKGMFRVVTQEFPDWRDRGDQFPSSTLYIIDARDPDEMEEVADLLIDDEGNLMATRFAGDRAYTIHLPESIDPLDVIDLSVPDDPELTDILEIPGWVEHMEVIGYNIIAIGVDNEDGRKVALYLFDVSDADNAVQLDRVVFGDGFTYSEANWDPKALTILEDEGLVVVPYSSYNWDWRIYNGNENGIQLISFDLEKGELELEGKVASSSEVRRSRVVSGNLVTTSDRVLQSIDFQDPAAPEVEAVIYLASNVADAFFSDGKIVTLHQPDYGSSGARIRVSSLDDPYDFELETGPDGLHFEGMTRVGDQVYIKGIRQGEDVEGGPVWELHRYDMKDPLQPLHYSVAKIGIPEAFTNDYSYYYGGAADTREKADGDDEEPVPEENLETVSMVWYDPFSWKILDDGTVAVYSYYYEYTYYYEKETGEDQMVKRIDLLRWTGPDSLQRRAVELPSTYYLQEVMGSWNGILASTYDYGSGNTIIRATFDNTEPDVSIGMTVKGRLVGVSGDLTHVYTALDYWMEDGSHNTMNVYDISSGAAVYLMGVELEGPIGSVYFQEDRVIVVSQDYYWYYDYGYPEDGIAYDEGDMVVEEGKSEEGSSEEEAAPREGDDHFPEHKTRIHVLGIEDGVYETKTTYTLEGIYSSSMLTEDVIMMQSAYTLVGVDLSGAEISEMGPFTASGYVRGGDMLNERMVLAMGLYGIEILDL
ncbi:MAG: beta-propeller domain-containing protein [Thermoplasmatota archaeon]